MNTPRIHADVYKTIQLKTMSAINQEILSCFLSMNENQFLNQTHYFQGRYENIYINPEFIPALKILIEHIKQEISLHLNEDVNNIKFGFWINVMHPEQTTSRHCHDDLDEVLSGVYYVKVPPHSGDLVFYADDTITLTPQEGLLVLFSPALEHEVKKNDSDEVRLSIGFNASLLSIIQ